jgi:DNA helicase-2/ATP-dependent DNA helicase PcrA
VVVFSRALRRYVEHVLPSLGLEKVRIASYREWAAEERRRHFPRLPSRQREDAPALVQRLKLHPMMGAALQAQIARMPGRAVREQALDDWISVLTQPALLEQVCAEVAPGAFSSHEIERFVDWNRARMEELDAGLAGDSEAPFELDVEDDALLLRSWQLRVGPLRGPGRRPLRFRHVVVDEVQDFSALEIRVLLECLGWRSHITLAGDSQQHVVESSGFTSWSEFFKQLGIAGSEVETLKVSYRSSQEIVDFSHSLLGDLREKSQPPIATRSGPPVELFQFGERGACVAFLGDALRDLSELEPLASVAILTPSAESSQHYYEGLARAELRHLRHVRDQDFSFVAGVEVTETDQVKGLEFDYVVLVDVNAGSFPDTPAARRLLHVGATRAVHQLWLCSVGRASPLVRHLGAR